MRTPPLVHSWPGLCAAHIAFQLLYCFKTNVPYIKTLVEFTIRFVIPAGTDKQASTVTFAKAYGDHMVLQSAPRRAQVWGWYTTATTDVAGAASKRDSVRITLTDAAGTNVFVGGTWIGADGMWVATLPPINASLAAYTVTIWGRRRRFVVMLLCV